MVSCYHCWWCHCITIDGVLVPLLKANFFHSWCSFDTVHGVFVPLKMVVMYHCWLFPCMRGEGVFCSTVEGVFVTLVMMSLYQWRWCPWITVESDLRSLLLACLCHCLQWFCTTVDHVLVPLLIVFLYYCWSCSCTTVDQVCVPLLLAFLHLICWHPCDDVTPTNLSVLACIISVYHHWLTSCQACAYAYAVYIFFALCVKYAVNTVFTV